LPYSILTLITFLPVAGAALLLFMRKASPRAIRNIALIVSLLTLLLSLPLFSTFDVSNPGMQFEQSVQWIPSLGVQYHVGIDGISLFLVLLTTVLTPIAILSSWNSIEKRVREYYLFMLMLETGMIGVFVALDLFLFFVFWEVSLVPMYFLIGIWGHDRRIYAALKFFLYTMAGSALMLVAILWLYTKGNSFDMPVLLGMMRSGTLKLSSTEGFWLFLAFFFAFAIKVPLFPLHTWLPDAHGEAPTAGSVMLASVLLKLGTYGIVRVCLPMFPEAARECAPWIVGLSIAGIIYGALVAMVQPNMKRLVAYSSVSHLGFVMLGMFALNPLGLEGSVLQMVNHGLSTGGLFLVVGLIYERRHTREISAYSGLAQVMPVYATLTLVLFLASMGLPLLNGFVGELLILQGAFAANRVWACWAVTGVVLGAAYMLWLYQRVFWGKVTHEENQKLKDLDRRELATLVPLVALCFWIGVYPKPFLDFLHEPVARIAAVVQPAKFAPAATDAHTADPAAAKPTASGN
jgi:NADH-quinone oxidoreductase subunit M